MRAAVIIPARLDSARFPGKVLAPLHGRPLIQHVWERACGSSIASEIIVATDSLTVLEAVHAFGGRAVMTDPGYKLAHQYCRIFRGLRDAYLRV